MRWQWCTSGDLERTAGGYARLPTLAVKTFVQNTITLLQGPDAETMLSRQMTSEIERLAPKSATSAF